MNALFFLLPFSVLQSDSLINSLICLILILWAFKKKAVSACIGRCSYFMSYAEALLRMDSAEALVKEHCHQERPDVEFFFYFKKIVHFCSHADKLLVLLMNERDGFKIRNGTSKRFQQYCAVTNRIAEACQCRQGCVYLYFFFKQTLFVFHFPSGTVIFFGFMSSAFQYGTVAWYFTL